jgi:hypothetical protein
MIIRSYSARGIKVIFIGLSGETANMDSTTYRIILVGNGGGYLASGSGNILLLWELKAIF